MGATKRSLRGSYILIGMAVLVVGVGMYAVGRTGLIGQAAPATKVARPAAVGLWVEGGDEKLTSQLEGSIRGAGYAVSRARSEQAAVVVVSKAERPGSVPIQLARVGQPAHLTGATIVEPGTRPNYYVSARPTNDVGEGARRELVTRLSSKPQMATSNEWSLNAVGDIIIGRTVYLQMQRYHDMLRPFAQFADTLKSTDLTLADLECTISDAHTIMTDGGMTFASPLAAAQGLKASGIDAVNVANNHSFNVGAAGFVDTLDAMKSLGIPTFGGGHNDQEAHRPLVTTVKGVKVGLLGYSSIVGSTAAGANSPGMAHLSMAPWDPFSEAEAQRMEADIRAAKQQADVVMVYYHWGTEYTHEANADQRQIAHRAIDAGADLILGTHPHWVQGVEWYKDRLITYSLGNFVFDQEWSTKTKQGTVLQATFDGVHLVKAEFLPYQIEDYNQPRPANAATAQAILSDIFTHSWWPASGS